MRILENDSDREHFRQLRDEGRALRAEIYDILRGHILRTGGTPNNLSVQAFDAAVEAYWSHDPVRCRRLGEIMMHRLTYASGLRLARKYGWRHVDPGKNDPAVIARTRRALEQRHVSEDVR